MEHEEEVMGTLMATGTGKATWGLQVAPKIGRGVVLGIEASTHGDLMLSPGR